MARVFFSYSHKDEELRDELEKHLTSLKRQSLIESWHDRRISAGDEWASQISEHLLNADVILLLISSDFIASRYCYELEMKEALRRHDAKEATVIPIILRPCDWQDLPFGKLQAATQDGRPVSKFQTLDDGFLEVVQSIKSILATKPLMQKAIQASLSGPCISTKNEVGMLGVTKGRSSNLSVRKQFSDRERDSFLIEAFAYVASYLENSLKELNSRNAELECQFRRRDANSFEAVVYSGGSQATKCGIWLDGGNFGQSGCIAFSYSGLGLGNSFNESLSVVDDGHCLGLRPLGMAINLGKGGETMLTQEGAAESLWTLFVNPLK